MGKLLHLGVAKALSSPKIRGTQRNEPRILWWELIKKGGKTGFKDELGKKT